MTRTTSLAAQEVECETCCGNGEIVTDWDRYKHPHDGDVGDEAVADCPDCDGNGKVEALSLAAQDGLVDALKEARRSLKMQEGAEIWNSNCVECDGEGEWTECPICSDAFGKAIDARNATFPLIDAALSAIKGDKS